MALSNEQLSDFAALMARVDRLPSNTSSVNELLGWMNNDNSGDISVPDLSNFMARLDYHAFDTNKIRRLLTDINRVTGRNLDDDALFAHVGTRINNAAEMETFVNYALTGQLPSPTTPSTNGSSRERS